MKKYMMVMMVLTSAACGDIEKKKTVDEMVCVEYSCSTRLDCSVGEECQNEICVGLSCQTASDCEPEQICWKGGCRAVEECQGN